MSSDKEAFLSRWSRRKREVAAKPAAPAPAPAKPVETQPVELPALDQLSFDSDFGAFLRANVEERVKRAALKKLFSDPRFNVMDGLDVYIDDYTKNDPIPEDMLKTLEHARSTLFGPQTEPEKTEPPQEAEAAQAKEAPDDGNPDGDSRQDT